jgi:transposase
MACPQKKARREGRTIVFVDESGLYLLPFLAKTYAPAGATPILRVRLAQEHLSIIGGITEQGRLYLRKYSHTVRQQEVVAFLEHLEHVIAGPLLVIWDGARIHRGKDVQEHLAQVGSKRLSIETLPAYAPDLNPIEGVWQYLKCHELKNICCRDCTELDAEFRYAKERIRKKPQLIRACFNHVGYY